MRSVKTLLLGLGAAMVWPSYLVLLAYAARVAPWPRATGRPAAFVLGSLAAAAWVVGASRFLLRPGGWGEEVLHVPPAAGKQIRRGVRVLLVSAIVLLVPRALLEQGWIAPAEIPVQAPEVCRLLEIGFGLVAWGVIFRLGRGRAVRAAWSSENPAELGWMGRHRRALLWSVLIALAGTIVLDVVGYGFTARRISKGGVELALLMALCASAYGLVATIIDAYSWRWIKDDGHAPAETAGADASQLPHRLRRLAAAGIPMLGALFGAWYWGFNAELIRALGDYPIWTYDPGADPSKMASALSALTVGDLTRALVALTLTAVAWRHMGDLFTLVIFPRMPEDPGTRFAVLTLAKYLALSVGLLAGLASVDLGPKEIGVVVAALGVGLGFGLQEIVSNFVSGIILLLERPIRVGDVVTVSNQTGKVDRINIRATTIINWDNQSMIIPNRAFITGNLVNWTHRDKVVRATIHLIVAQGTDPDRVSDLLLVIAREDPDVLRNPVPAAMMESFGDWGLCFSLYVHVPEPGLAGRVKHRLFAQIQKRFTEAGIELPVPTREIRLHGEPATPTPMLKPLLGPSRSHEPSPTPPPPRFATIKAVEPLTRCVDD